MGDDQTGKISSLNITVYDDSGLIELKYDGNGLKICHALVSIMKEHEIIKDIITSAVSIYNDRI